MNLSSLLNNTVNILAVTVFAVCWTVLIGKFIKHKFSDVKEVNAIVADKYKSQTVSEIQGTFKRERCIVVFSVGGKRLAFNVSEFSFCQYKIGQKGVLKYKGNTLIDFS